MLDNPEEITDYLCLQPLMAITVRPLIYSNYCNIRRNQQQQQSDAGITKCLQQGYPNPNIEKDTYYWIHTD